MSVKKQFLKSKPVCKCTFSLPKDAVKNAQSVTLVGEFNNWDPAAQPLKRLKSGEYKVQISLPAGERFQYKYLIDGQRWENDWQADDYEYVPEIGADNSVVQL